MSNITLCGKKVKCVKQVKHLGNIVSFDLDEGPESTRKISDYFFHVNSLKANFRGVRLDVIIKLFKAYCMTFYGSQAWNLSQSCIDNICVKYNRGIRFLLNLPLRTHRNLLPPLIGTAPLKVQLLNRFHRMHCTMRHSRNATINSVTSILLSDNRSITSLNLNKSCSTLPSDPEAAVKASLIRDIIDSNFQSPLLTRDEIEYILEDICIH